MHKQQIYISEGTPRYGFEVPLPRAVVADFSLTFTDGWSPNTIENVMPSYATATTSIKACTLKRVQALYSERGRG